MKFMEAGLFAFSAIIGLVWIFSVQSIPAADSYNIYETASQTAQGNYASLHNGSDFYNKDFYSGFSYYNCYPFQLGFVLISEIVYRIFGTDSTMPLQVINVLCVAAAYLGIAKITKQIFGRNKIEFIVICTCRLYSACTFLHIRIRQHNRYVLCNMGVTLPNQIFPNR